jgi:acid phosphatase (class B)
MHRLKVALSAFVFTMLTCTTLQAAGPVVVSTQAPKSLKGKLVTVEAIRKSLPAAPIVAGFDIDDTVVFSSPGFYLGGNNTDGPGGKNRYGDNFIQNPQFWKDMNQYHDRYSMKKKSGDDLVQMHKKRGDTIVFITKRTCYDNDAAVIQGRLQGMFNVQSKVYCTDEQSKTPLIASTGVYIYYGDSDTDITYTQAVQKSPPVRPVRVERSRLSTNHTDYNPGKYGEEVLAGSEN